MHTSAPPTQFVMKIRLLDPDIFSSMYSLRCSNPSSTLNLTQAWPWLAMAIPSKTSG